MLNNNYFTHIFQFTIVVIIKKVIVETPGIDNYQHVKNMQTSKIYFATYVMSTPKKNREETFLMQTKELIQLTLELKLVTKIKLGLHTWCVKYVRQWNKGRRRSLKFGVHMIWRKPANHFDDCKFCLNKIIGINKNRYLFITLGNKKICFENRPGFSS